MYASPELRAECYASSTIQCIIRFSSSLVDLLDEEEFAFVAGHELGHFLLGHGLTHIERQSESIEYFIQQRAQEISVDRIGLVACDSVDVALRALMKVASGLNDRHLRFDVGAFIAQLRMTAPNSGSDNHRASHPSILVRCRALLWFSLNDVFTKRAEVFVQSQMQQLDARIQDDINTYVPIAEARQQYG